jgi:hypothetical protein
MVHLRVKINPFSNFVPYPNLNTISELYNIINIFNEDIGRKVHSIMYRGKIIPNSEDDLPDKKGNYIAFMYPIRTVDELVSDLHPAMMSLLSTKSCFCIPSPYEINRWVCENFKQYTDAQKAEFLAQLHAVGMDIYFSNSIYSKSYRLMIYSKDRFEQYCAILYTVSDFRSRDEVIEFLLERNASTFYKIVFNCFQSNYFAINGMLKRGEITPFERPLFIVLVEAKIY